MKAGPAEPSKPGARILGAVWLGPSQAPPGWLVKVWGEPALAGAAWADLDLSGGHARVPVAHVGDAGANLIFVVPRDMFIALAPAPLLRLRFLPPGPPGEDLEALTSDFQLDVPRGTFDLGVDLEPEIVELLDAEPVEGSGFGCAP